MELLILHIKPAFRIYPLHVLGYTYVCAIVLLSVLLYKIIVDITVKTKMILLQLNSCLEHRDRIYTIAITIINTN